MKSLEIVNESIEYIEFILKNDGGMDNEQKEQFKISLKKSKQIKQDLERLEKLERERELLEHDGLILVSTSVIDRIHKMQQDLEVLEIIKKHTKIHKSIVENKEYHLLNFAISNYWLNNREDFDKLKQWLEVNENETNL